MVTIGILGANGQVGSEVCLLLSQMQDVTVIPICRTELGSTLLRRCGLECRHGEVSSASETSTLLAGCDLIADFTLPQATSASEIRAAIKKTIRGSIEQAPQGARFVYLSSLLAVGFGELDQTLRRHLLARTLYGTTKRYGERFARQMGKRFNREVFVLRLGQVHGELQSVSRSILQGMEGETAYVPAGLSYAVFAFTIAEALVNIARGKEKPGRYSLISAPEWSWKEIYQYYARRKGIDADIVTVDESFLDRRRRFPLKARALGGRIARPVADFAGRYRELITGYFLRFFPDLEQKLRATWGRRKARQDVSQMMMLQLEGRYRPFNIYGGEATGERLQSLSDCRSTMTQPVLGLRDLLQEVVKEDGVAVFRTPPEKLSSNLSVTILDNAYDA